MEIFPNPPFAALMTLPFVVTFFGLHFLLFKPLFAYLEERDAASHGARAEAASLKGDIDAKLSEVNAKVDEARRVITTMRASRRADALKTEANILADARATAEKAVSEAVAQVAQERAAASAQLKGTAAMLSKDIAAQVLGREVS